MEVCLWYYAWHKVCYLKFNVMQSENIFDERIDFVNVL